MKTPLLLYITKLPGQTRYFLTYYLENHTNPYSLKLPVDPCPIEFTSLFLFYKILFMRVSLHRLVTELIQSLMPLAIRRRNLVLNGISRELRVNADENMLAYVLWSLINGAIQSTQNACIHVESIIMGDRQTILIKGVGAYFYHTISREYRQVQHVADQLGVSIMLAA